MMLHLSEKCLEISCNKALDLSEIKSSKFGASFNRSWVDCSLESRTLNGFVFSLAISFSCNSAMCGLKKSFKAWQKFSFDSSSPK